MIWLVFIILLIIFQGYQYRKLKGSWTKISSSEKTIFFANHCNKQIKIRDVYDSSQIFTLGILHPTIYISENMPNAEKKLAIEHEIYHILHRDGILKLIGFFVVILHWYCPVCWLYFISFEDTLELLCDRKVLRNATEEEEKKYIQLILQPTTQTMPKLNHNWRINSFYSSNFKRMKERIFMIKYRNQRKKVGLVWSMIITSIFISFTPVLAYQMPVARNYEETLLPDGTEPTTFGEEIDFNGIDDATNKYDNLTAYDFIFSSHQQYILFNDGYYLVIPNITKDAIIPCSHTWENATRRLHLKASDGGCYIKTYKAVVCRKCSKIKSSTLISETHYVKCPH